MDRFCALAHVFVPLVIVAFALSCLDLWAIFELAKLGVGMVGLVVVFVTFLLLMSVPVYFMAKKLSEQTFSRAFIIGIILVVLMLQGTVLPHHSDPRFIPPRFTSTAI